MEIVLVVPTLLAILGVSVYIVIPHMVKLLLKKRSLRVFGGGNAIYLTFDDGPDVHATDKILDILQEYGATAMFFITGEHAKKHPECVERIIAGNNIIGEHGCCHIHPWKSGPVRTVRDFFKGRAIFKEIEQKLHYTIKYYRPPYGKYNIVSLMLYLWYGKIPVFWHLDPKDYRAEKPGHIVHYLKATMPEGQVVLLHDGRYGKNNAADTTVEAVRALLSEGAALRWEFSIDRFR
jgi:peptidoglycan/xylan/chitin deacetylase (PgdA/CDA1 family)